jgi:hypothetical protein
MFEKIIDELVDGKKTYSVSGFAFFSNILEKLPESIPEWTELFNLGAAILAFVLVAWRLGHKIKGKKNDPK